MTIVRLTDRVRFTDRAVIRVAGEDARVFLDRLVTCDLDRVAPGRPRYGALLTPQGKIIADFILHELAGDTLTFLLDTAAAPASDLAKRLAMYKLRAKVTVADASSEFAVAAGWDDAPLPADAVAAAPDPRLPALGWRAIVPLADAPADASAEAYAAHRIALGVPEGGRDFAFADAFPHEALMDQMAGVDFDKGCYVGQEVVSRMQHRGTARTRIVPFEYGPAAAPEPGLPVAAGDRALGTTGSRAGSRGLATLRLDRLADALSEGTPVTAGGVPARLVKPDWITFAYPTARPLPAA